MIKFRGTLKTGKTFSSVVHVNDIPSAGSAAFSALSRKGIAATEIASIKFTQVDDADALKISEPRKKDGDAAAPAASKRAKK